MILHRKMTNICVAIGFVGAAIGVFASNARAQQDFSQVEIKSTTVAEGVYMLEGAGGNMGLSVGADGAFLIDDQFAPLSDKIKAAIAAITDKPLRFVLNTHYHFDHTGGNENLGTAGATIVAHDNVRARLLSGSSPRGGTVPQAPKSALPVVTYGQDISFHINGHDVHAFHVDPAHTDGDSIVHLRGADVIHSGDVFIRSSYPFVDAGAGGTFGGIIAGYDRLLEIAGPNTKIIPGHGPLSARADVVRQRDILVTIRDRVLAAKAQGQSLEQVQAAKPTAEFDAVFEGGFISGEALVEVIYGGN